MLKLVVNSTAMQRHTCMEHGSMATVFTGNAMTRWPIGSSFVQGSYCVRALSNFFAHYCDASVKTRRLSLPRI